MSAIKVFEHGTVEYARLAAVAAALTELSPKGYNYYVGVTYFDHGQDWKWTTVLCDGGWCGYQALNPREQEDVLSGVDVIEVANMVLSDKYCPDRVA